MATAGYHTAKNRSFIGRIKDKIFVLLRLTNDPVVKVYNGFGNNQSVTIFGHVFSFSPIPRKRFRQSMITNMFALLRLFMVKTVKGAIVKLEWQNQTYEAKTAEDGFFKFEWNPGDDIQPGWYPVTVQLIKLNGRESSGVQGNGHVLIPDRHQYSCISDIDDTFLISHSANLRKRLYVLFTENAHSRKPFAGVVEHYKLLSEAGAVANTPNPFFYVSSSEWNLYDYISEFSRMNELPKGIYLLNQVKTFKEIFKTGQNKHTTKFMRITRIIEAYPTQRFILLGDNSQQDPVIYASIVEHFPEKIECVYLRNVHRANHEKVEATVKKIQEAGIECCYFEHSAEAIKHSKEIGLIRGVET